MKVKITQVSMGGSPVPITPFEIDLDKGEAYLEVRNPADTRTTKPERLDLKEAIKKELGL